jgi:hypothetical protein
MPYAPNGSKKNRRRRRRRMFASEIIYSNNKLQEDAVQGTLNFDLHV